MEQKNLNQTYRFSKYEMYEVLYAMLGNRETVDKWWYSPNRAWEGRKPDDVWKSDPESVITYILGYAYK